MDTANGTAVVAFDAFFNGKVEIDGPRPFHMIKKADGKWYMQGDWYIADVEVETRAEYRFENTNTATIKTGLRINIEDRGGRGITKAVVTGAGLPSGGVTLINNIAWDQFQIEGQNSGDFYAMTDGQIAAIADSGEAYTVKLYIGDTLAATYTEKLTKRPYLNTELTAAMFPAITSPTMTEMRAFTGGSGTVSWTLPAGLDNGWLSVGLNDHFGNSAIAEFSPAPADRSKTFTLNPETSTGEAFTPTSGWIWLMAHDSYDRTFGTGINVWW